MEEVGKPTGLVRRKDSASWQLRQRWPKHLRQPGDPADVWISLETTSYQDAVRKLPEVREALQRRFTHTDKPVERTGIYSRSPVRAEWPCDENLPLLRTDHTAPLAQAFFAETMRGLDGEAPASWAKGDPEWRSWREELENILAHLTGPETERGEGYVVGATIRVLAKAGLRTEPASEACNLLHNYLRRAMAQSYRIMLARLNGDHSDQIADRLFGDLSSGHRDVGVNVTEPGQERVGTTSLDPDILDRWAKERKVSAKGVDKHRAVARWFREYTGAIPVEAITRKDVLSFKNRLVENGISAANANTKLSCLRTLLGYAVENDLLDANPADRIYVQDKDKDRRKRKEFDLPSLHALFESPVYAVDERPVAGRGEAAYWMPLIALYTGARLEEIAQLRVKDVRQERYIDSDDCEQVTWVMCVMQEDDLTTKNPTSERRIPIHPDLVRLGLIQHVENAAAVSEVRVFPALKPNLYGRLGAKWGEWWSVYRRDVCGIVDRRMVFHSFRHTFKYHARHVGMIEGVQRQIMGHSPGDTADEYGPSRYSLHQLVEGMKLYRVPGLVLPPPPPPCR